MKTRKTEMNVALKVAIVQSRYTSRRISLKARIPEQRLSAIIHNKATATDDERSALARVLAVDVATIFPTESLSV